MRQAQEWRELQYQQIMIWWVAKMDPKSWRALEKIMTPRTEVENGEVLLSCDRTLQPCCPVLCARSRRQAARGDARCCRGAEKAILGKECWRGGNEGLGRPRGNGYGQGRLTSRVGKWGRHVASDIMAFYIEYQRAPTGTVEYPSSTRHFSSTQLYP